MSRLLASVVILTAASARAEEPAVPAPVSAADYPALLERPPFRQPLSLSESLVLSGVARLPGGPVVTLWNRATGETFMVSARPNAQGWTLVDLPEISDLKSVFATIDAAGTRLTVRFDPERLIPPKLDNKAKPGARSEESLVVEALLRTLDPAASRHFEALPAEGQEKFRKDFGAYLSTYPTSSDDDRRTWLPSRISPEKATPAPVTPPSGQ